MLPCWYEMGISQGSRQANCFFTCNSRALAWVAKSDLPFALLLQPLLPPVVSDNLLGEASIAVGITGQIILLGPSAMAVISILGGTGSSNLQKPLRLPKMRDLRLYYWNNFTLILIKQSSYWGSVPIYASLPLAGSSLLRRAWRVCKCKRTSLLKISTS